MKKGTVLMSVETLFEIKNGKSQCGDALHEELTMKLYERTSNLNDVINEILI